MKKECVLTCLSLIISLSTGVWAQDPEGALDYAYVVCGPYAYQGPGQMEVTLQLRCNSDNSGNNRIRGITVPLIITGNNIASVDTSPSKAFSGSFAYGAVIKHGNPDPSVPPFHVTYLSFVFFTFTGDGLFSNVILNVNDTGTICIDTLSSGDYQPEFVTTLAATFRPGWSGPYCCNIPPAIVRSLSGKKFNDLNANCIQDQGEIGLSGWIMTLNPGSFATITDSNGDYTFYDLPAGVYTVGEVLKPHWERTCPSSPGTYQVILSEGQEISGLNFGNRFLGSPQDLAVYAAGTRARPGFYKSYSIWYQNKGAVTADVSVNLFLPAQVFHSQNSSGGTYNPGTHSVTWNVGQVPFGYWNFLWCKVGIPVSTPLGTWLQATAQILPISGDAIPGDNTYYEYQLVRGSYDPNEKLVIPVGSGSYGGIAINETLTYQINFQNVGTDTAFNIVVGDTLDSNLDITTLEFGAASHSYTFQINGRELEWTFTNINLPDSIVDEPGSHGFVTYRVLPREDVALGTDLTNKAGIYFDFNLPVVTNTVSNRVCTMPGDANNSGTWNLADVIATVNYIFNKPGCTPQPLCWLSGLLCRGDWNGSGTVALNDVIRAVNYLFNKPGGPWNAQPSGVCCIGAI